MLPIKLQEIIDDFTVLDTQEEKYEALIEYGRRLPEFSDDLKTERNLIAGCMSKVYVDVKVEDGVVKLQGFAQSILVRGLIAVLVIGLNGLSVNDILNLDEGFIKKLGITQSLTVSRANTPLTVLKTIKTRINKQIN